MELNRLLTDAPLILTEAAVIEAIDHASPGQLHPDLFNAVMVNSPDGRDLLARLYTSFYDVARAHDLPFILTTPTWRANRQRVAAAGISQDINEEAVAFLRHLIQELKAETRISLGGLLGCKHDCYRPEHGLDTPSAHRFHAWQAEHLADGGADFLMAVTLPALAEAKGLAMAMAETGLPYVISFVINRKGEVLDGTPWPGQWKRWTSAFPLRRPGTWSTAPTPLFSVPIPSPKRCTPVSSDSRPTAPHWTTINWTGHRNTGPMTFGSGQTR